MRNPTNSFVGGCQNVALELKIWLYRTYEKSPSKGDFMKELTLLKKEVPWMEEVNAQTMQAVIERLFLAYDAFFRRVKKGETPGFPKWAKKSSWDSLVLKQGIKVLANESKLFLPKIGHVRFRQSQPIEGKIKRAAVVREHGGWFVCLFCETDIPPLPATTGEIGIDIGLKHVAVTSDGEFFENPRIHKQYEKRINKAQKKLSRKKKRSKNRKKVIEELKRLYQKEKNTREDHLHKLTSKLIDENQVIIAEDLQVANLVRKNKAKKDENGKYLKNGQAQKKGLNRFFSDVALGTLLHMLEYKALWYGRTFIRVPAHHTSSDCSECGWRNEDLTLADREWKCLKCGTHHERDENAARNILARGKEIINKGAGTPLLHLEIQKETSEPVGAGAEGPIRMGEILSAVNASARAEGGCQIAAIKGYGEEADARHVADYGSCIAEVEARVFFPQFAERAYNAKSGA